MKQLSNRYVGMELSNATMTAEDLIPTFMNFLQMVAEECAIHKEVDALQEEVDGLEIVEHPGYGEQYKDEDLDKSTWILNEDIWNLLQEIAPGYTYFGSHEGDGACYGFWTDDELLQDALLTTIQELEYQPELADIRECCEYVINLLGVHQR